MVTDKITALAVMVERGVERCEAQRYREQRRSPDAFEDQARRCERVAELFDREARWWDVLIAPTYHRVNGVPRAYGMAVIAARSGAKHSAERYREFAQEWRRFAAKAAARSAVAA